MSRITVVLILLVAALLEAGGDALMRQSLHSKGVSRFLLFGLGACVLAAYGGVVNSPPWDFGKLIGLYVVLFFISAQLISWLAFGQPPTRAVLVGGLLIVCGGIVIAVSQA